MCLPKEWCPDEYHISNPRLERRKILASAGLIGKIEFHSDVSSEQVRKVICTTLATPILLLQEDIQEGRLFPFKYLQRLGAGARTLHVPSVSATINWNGRQVASLAKLSGIIYILAESDVHYWSHDDTQRRSDIGVPISNWHSVGPPLEQTYYAIRITPKPQ